MGAGMKCDEPTLSALDWQVEHACEYSQHDIVGGGAASWAVWLTASPCGCDSAIVILFCEPCWAYRIGPGPVACSCGQTSYPPLEDVLRIERLSQ